MELDTIVVGDCLDVMGEMPDGCVNMVLTDPPYGITACKWDSIIPLEPMWEQLKRVIKPNGAIVMTASQPFTSILGTSNIEHLRYSWFWEKPHTGQLNSKRMPLKNVEECLVFYLVQPTYNPQFDYDNPYVIHRKGYKGSECYGTQRDHTTVSDGKRYPKQILRFKHDKQRIHPTQKPVALMEYLIKTYTNEGDIVLDFAVGSGTTAVAALKLGRHFYGCDINPEYVELANKRIEKARLEMAQIELPFPDGGD